MEGGQLERISNYSNTNQDPEVFQRFIDKYVRVNLIKNCNYTGFVHSIDPVSYSIILSVPSDNSYRTVLIPGYAITDLEQINSDCHKSPPKRKPNTEIPLEEIIKKRKQVVGWFKQNLLPVSEAGQHIVVGNVTLLPPYTASDICTDNPVVSLQIKSIIEKMPVDYEPK